MLFRSLALLETIHNTIAAMTSSQLHEVVAITESLNPTAWTDVTTTAFILENLQNIFQHSSASTRKQLALQLDGMIPYGHMDAKISVAVFILDLISGSDDFVTTRLFHIRQLLFQTQWYNHFRTCPSQGRAGKVLRLWGFSFWTATQRAGSLWTEGITDVEAWMDIVLTRLNEYNVCTVRDSQRLTR